MNYTASHDIDTAAQEQVVALQQRVNMLEQQLADAQREAADLRESRALFWSIIDHVPALVYAKDKTGRYLLVNRQYEHHTGYTSEQIIGRTPQEVFPGAPMERWHDFDQQVLETEQPCEFNDVIVYREMNFTVLVIKFPCYTADGELRAIGGIVLDMSAHRRTEEALQRSEAQYRMLAENMQDVVWTIDANLQMTYASPSVYQLRGYTPEEVLQQSLDELLTPDSQQLVGELLQKEHYTIERLELTQPCKDGSTVITECIVVPIYTDDHTLTGWVGVSRDITARKQAEAEREHAHALMHAAVESATGGVLVVARDGGIVTCNQRFRHMWHLPADWCSTIANGIWPEALRHHVAEPDTFVQRIADLSATPEAESYDLIALRDGRILERYSTPYRVGSEIAGRLWSCRDVTQRQRAEAATRETAQRLQGMFNNAAVGVVLVSPEGDFIEINDRWAEMLRMSRAAVLGGTYLDVTYPDDVACSIERMAPVFHGENDVLRLEKRYLRADGSVFWGDTSVRALRDEYGVLEGLIGVVVDITERRQAEAMLRLQERALASVTNGILISDATLPDMPITYCNESFQRMTGYTLAEIVGQNCRFLQGPDTDRATVAQIRTLLRHEQPFQVILLNYRKDGTPFWNELSITPLHDEQGRLTHHIGVINDITERKLMQDALRASEEKFRGFFEQSRDGLILIGEQGTIIDWSLGAERIFGLRRAEVVGRSHWDVLYQLTPAAQRTPETYALIKTRTREFLNRRDETMQAQITPIHAERGFERPDGTQGVVATLVFPIQTAGRTLLGSISRDITQQKQTEEELQRLNRELRQSNDHLGVSLRELERRTREITLLNELSDFLQTCQSVEEAYTVFASVVERLFVQQPGALYHLSNDGDQAVLVAHWGAAQPWTSAFQVAQCWALRRRRPISKQHTRSGLSCQCINAVDAIESFCVPLLARDEMLGVLRLYGNPVVADEARERSENLAISVADHLALALANLRLRERLQDQAVRDSLTGLFNRRYLDETLTRELQRAARHRHPVGVIMLDVDHFKQINDTHGHPAGDVMLAAIGAFLQQHTRGEDIVCRYGGEEFTLVFPEASLADTYARAEEIRRGAQELAVRHKDQTLEPITISLGVASFPAHGVTASALLRAADAALYRAKTQGRNRTIMLEAVEAHLPAQ
jgi:diguanylate cyclase (GGDEF)-like protein/PAS domain S-box-containing protein